MSEINIFEYATRNKLRFNYRGTIDVESLWGLNVNSLNEVYKGLCIEKKENFGNEESLLTTTNSKAEKDLEVKIKIVKYIFEKKTSEQNERIAYAEKEERRQFLRELIAKKESEAYDNKSIEELREELNNL